MCGRLDAVLAPTAFTYERLYLGVTGAAMAAAWRAAPARPAGGPVLGTRLDSLRALVRANLYELATR